MRVVVLFFTLLILFAGSAYSLSIEEKLENTADEQKAEALFKEIRCMVCSGESVADSRADLARQLRKVIRDEIQAGASAKEVKNKLVAAYGDVILMTPPFAASTLILWLGPLFMLLIGGAVFVVLVRRKRNK